MCRYLVAFLEKYQSDNTICACTLETRNDFQSDLWPLSIGYYNNRPHRSSEKPV